MAHGARAEQLDLDPGAVSNSNSERLMYLVITMIAAMTIGIVSFTLVEHKARKDGLIDKKEEY